MNVYCSAIKRIVGFRMVMTKDERWPDLWGGWRHARSWPAPTPLHPLVPLRLPVWAAAQEHQARVARRSTRRAAAGGSSGPCRRPPPPTWGHPAEVGVLGQPRVGAVLVAEPRHGNLVLVRGGSVRRRAGCRRRARTWGTCRAAWARPLMAPPAASSSV